VIGYIDRENPKYVTRGRFNVYYLHAAVVDIIEKLKTLNDSLM
jgi:hypothetical protein